MQGYYGILWVRILSPERDVVKCVIGKCLVDTKAFVMWPGGHKVALMDIFLGCGVCGWGGLQPWPQGPCHTHHDQ